jgi:hypothetical protein
MSQCDFYLFTNLIIFFSKSKWSNISFPCFIFTFVQNFKPPNKFLKKRLVMTCVFECFQSHCHILKELHEFLCTMDAINIFGKNSLIFSFVGYGLVTKWLGAECTFEEVVEKTNCQKMNVNFFTTKLRWIVSPRF